MCQGYKLSSMPRAESSSQTLYLSYTQKTVSLRGYVKSASLERLVRESQTCSETSLATVRTCKPSQLGRGFQELFWPE